MRFFFLFLACVFLASISFAAITSRLNIVEQDGSPTTWPWQLKVTNGSLTDNGDGTASLATGSSGGGGGILTTFALTDIFSVQWTVSISSSGALTTTATPATSSTLVPHSLTFRDNSENNWAITVSTNGNLVTTSVTNYRPSTDSLFLTDASAIAWLVTTSTDSHLNTN